METRMPKRPSHPRSAGDFANRPDHDREWSRPGPDVADLGADGGGDTIRSFGGVPREDAQAIEEARRANYPYADVASAARRGRFFGRGPKGYRRSDERIRE